MNEALYRRVRVDFNAPAHEAITATAKDSLRGLIVELFNNGARLTDQGQVELWTLNDRDILPMGSQGRPIEPTEAGVYVLPILPEMLRGSSVKLQVRYTKTGEQIRSAVLPVILSPAIDSSINGNEKTVMEEIREATAIVKEAGRVSAEDLTKIKETREAVERIKGEIVTEEADRKKNEAERIKAEGLRAEAESARQQAEGKRAADEHRRASAEQTRGANEAERIEHESARASSEQQRQQAEERRMQAEEQRNTSEQQRTQAAESLKTAEAQRVTNEQERQTAEEDRKAHETQRIEAEGQRAQAEVGRTSEETRRSDAEQGRIKQAATDHQRAEEDHARFTGLLDSLNKLEAGQLTVDVTHLRAALEALTGRFDTLTEGVTDETLDTIKELADAIKQGGAQVTALTENVAKKAGKDELAEQRRALEALVNQSIQQASSETASKLAGKVDTSAMTSALAQKVDKVTGKGLSANDFTDALKSKLDGITANANRTVVVNTLTETGAGLALDARQGKELKRLIDEKPNTPVVDSLTSTRTDAALSAAQGKELKRLIDIKPNTPVVNSLTSTRTDAALSAAQGKILKELIDRNSGGVIVEGTPPSEESKAIAAGTPADILDRAFGRSHGVGRILEAGLGMIDAPFRDTQTFAEILNNATWCRLLAEKPAAARAIANSPVASVICLGHVTAAPIFINSQTAMEAICKVPKVVVAIANDPEAAKHLIASKVAGPLLYKNREAIKPYMTRKQRSVTDTSRLTLSSGGITLIAAVSSGGGNSSRPSVGFSGKLWSGSTFESYHQTTLSASYASAEPTLIALGDVTVRGEQSSLKITITYYTLGGS